MRIGSFGRHEPSALLGALRELERVARKLSNYYLHTYVSLNGKPANPADKDVGGQLPSSSQLPSHH